MSLFHHGCPTEGYIKTSSWSWPWEVHQSSTILKCVPFPNLSMSHARHLANLSMWLKHDPFLHNDHHVPPLSWPFGPSAIRSQTTPISSITNCHAPTLAIPFQPHYRMCGITDHILFNNTCDRGLHLLSILRLFFNCLNYTFINRAENFLDHS